MKKTRFLFKTLNGGCWQVMDKWSKLAKILPKGEEYVETLIPAFCICYNKSESPVPVYIKEFIIIKANASEVILLEKSSKISVKTARRLEAWTNSPYGDDDIVVQYIKELFRDEWFDNLSDAKKAINNARKRQIAWIKDDIKRIRISLRKEENLLKLCQNSKKII